MEWIERNKEIYETAFQTYGDDTRSCLWDRPMIMRYRQLLKIAPLEGASVLDIGCGLGGLYEYMTQDSGIRLLEYRGVDLVEGMVELAGKKYPKAVFEKRDIFEDPIKETYDYVFCCGVFNNSMEGSDLYMRKMLREAFSYCRKGLAFNFISEYTNFRDEEMAYHNPQEVLAFCVENLSRKVNMHHHYEKADVSVFVYR